MGNTVWGGGIILNICISSWLKAARVGSCSVINGNLRRENLDGSSDMLELVKAAELNFLELKLSLL